MIGQIVSSFEIEEMNTFISKYGETAFFSEVYDGTFRDVAYAYIHPCDEMRDTKDFELIQKAFINAYV